MTEIWRGQVLWQGYVHPHNHPHTQLKKSGIPHTHTHTKSMRGFPIKTGRVRTIPTGAGLFVISNNTLILFRVGILGGWSKELCVYYWIIGRGVGENTQFCS